MQPSYKFYNPESLINALIKYSKEVDDPKLVIILKASAYRLNKQVSNIRKLRVELRDYRYPQYKIQGSSSGRTASFDVANRGSNPCP